MILGEIDDSVSLNGLQVYLIPIQYLLGFLVGNIEKVFALSQIAKVRVEHLAGHFVD